MPKITEERRVERRQQILNAAWTCFQREGLHSTTMDDIIQASGLSAGAVYSYFTGKENIILAAVTTSLSGIKNLLGPLFLREIPPGPEDLVREITEKIAKFTARDGFDLRRLALLGWSEAQRNEHLRATMKGFYLEFRNQLATIATTWRSTGVIDRKARPEDVAKALLALILGYVVQSALLGDVEPPALGRGAVQLAVGRKKK